MPLFSHGPNALEKGVSTKPKVQHVKQVVSDARNQREEGLIGSVGLCSLMGVTMGSTARQRRGI